MNVTVDWSIVEGATRGCVSPRQCPGGDSNPRHIYRLAVLCYLVEAVWFNVSIVHRRSDNETFNCVPV